MKPDVYQAAYNKALKAATGHLPNPGDELEQEAAERYARAAGEEALAASEWENAGRPFTISHSNGTTGKHPAYVAVLEAARSADRALRSVPRGARRAGPRTVGDKVTAGVRGPKLRPMESR